MAFHTSTEVTTKRMTRPILLSTGIAVMLALMASLLITQMASATPPSGLTGTTLVSGNLSQPQNVSFKGLHRGHGRGIDVNTITMVRYEIEPGGSFGWHQHGGPLWVAVAEGELTFYSTARGCVGRKHPAGTAFVDPGDMTHTARNEGSHKLVIYVTFMLPEGAPPRIDMPNPGVCPF